MNAKDILNKKMSKLIITTAPVEDLVQFAFPPKPKMTQFADSYMHHWA